ncbi:MAG: helix-turn-helix domain-containing protein [Bacteroidales bacterium]|nr:helix-turn-helix domain-containing protein [Bacteroidales bacterium]
MKASYEHIDTGSFHKQLSISQAAFEFFWHYHPEIELTYILKGTGERIVGDHTGSFSAGDLVLVGSNLPHTWTSTGSALNPDSCKAIVVQFRSEMFDFRQGGFPEFENIRNLIVLSQRGIRFSPAIAAEAGRQMMLLQHKQGLPWLAGFWTLLDFLGHSDDFILLSSVGYSPSLKRLNQDRIAKVFQFMGQNFKSEIRLRKVAEMVCMTETSFSRFFRKNTGMTFNDYLNELRLSHACRLLVDHPEKSIAEAGWESGFRSSTHFNRMFLSRKGISPSAFKKCYKKP